jgi:hypothetical protein
VLAAGAAAETPGVGQYNPSPPEPGGSGGGAGAPVGSQLSGPEAELLKKLAENRKLGAPPASGKPASSVGDDGFFDAELLILIGILATIGAGGVAWTLLKRRAEGTG